MISGSTETVQFTDTTTLAAGTDFGTRYRIVSLLGQGAMGRVYKAFDKDLERAVAIKVVRPGMMAESDALKRFKQETAVARVALILCHKIRATVHYWPSRRRALPGRGGTESKPGWFAQDVVWDTSVNEL